MKEYSSIESCPGPLSGNWYVFDKLDGSNIRIEVTKKGIIKFGKRNGLLDDSYPILKRSIDLIKAQEEALMKVFNKIRAEKLTCYFEFYGPSSFAGWHNENELQTCTLIDIDIYKKGLIAPKEFVSITNGVIDTARLLYIGNITKPILDEISNGTLEGMTFEGVIMKGPINKYKQPQYYKWKNVNWFEKLKPLCKDDKEFEMRK